MLPDLSREPKVIHSSIEPSWCAAFLQAVQTQLHMLGHVAASEYTDWMIWHSYVPSEGIH